MFCPGFTCLFFLIPQESARLLGPTRETSDAMTADSHHDVSPLARVYERPFEVAPRGERRQKKEKKRTTHGPLPVVPGRVRPRDAKQKPGDAPTASSDLYNPPGDAGSHAFSRFLLF